MIVYVSGPYSSPDGEPGQLANTERAMAAGLALLEMGHAPLIPHLSHWFDLWVGRERGERLPWQLFMDWDIELIRGCNALLYLAPSRGADIEKAHAEAMGIPVYTALSQVPHAGARRAGE